MRIKNGLSRQVEKIILMFSAINGELFLVTSKDFNSFPPEEMHKNTHKPCFYAYYIGIFMQKSFCNASFEK